MSHPKGKGNFNEFLIKGKHLKITLSNLNKCVSSEDANMQKIPHELAELPSYSLGKFRKILGLIAEGMCMCRARKQGRKK